MRPTRATCDDESSAASAPLLSDQAWREVGLSLQLSPRELEIARFIFADFKEAAIGDALGISPHTVRTHTERLYRKLGVGSRVALVVRVVAEFHRLTIALESSLPPLCPNHVRARCPLSD